MKLFLGILLSGTILFSYAQNTSTNKTSPATTTPPASTKTTNSSSDANSLPKPPANKTVLEEYMKQTKEQQAKLASAPPSNPNAKPFPFLGSFTLNYEERDSTNRINKGTIKYAFDTYAASIIPTFQNMKAIVHMNAVINIRDLEMVVLTTDSKNKKSGLLTKIPDPLIAKKDTSKAKPPVITKTGKTKTIQGLKCEEYLVNFGDTTKINSWVTTELNMNSSDLFRLVNIGFKGRSPFGYTDMNAIKGVAVESTITKKDKTTMLITLTDIIKTKPSPILFSTDGYTLTDARSLPMFTPRN